MTKHVLVLQQHPGWSCKQLQKQWGDKGGIPFLYFPSLLQTFDALMFHSEHHCWQGEHPGWGRGGTEHRVEQRQKVFLMCFRKTFFFPNPNLILIYILEHEGISHPISYFQRARLCFGWIFALISVAPTVHVYLITGILSDIEFWPSVIPHGKELCELTRGKPFPFSFGVQC